MKYISVEIAAAINKTMIETYSKGELLGVKEPHLLDSAINFLFISIFQVNLTNPFSEFPTKKPR
jgi:hypothetical protein